MTILTIISNFSWNRVSSQNDFPWHNCSLGHQKLSQSKNNARMSNPRWRRRPPSWISSWIHISDKIDPTSSWNRSNLQESITWISFLTFLHPYQLIQDGCRPPSWNYEGLMAEKREKWPKNRPFYLIFDILCTWHQCLMCAKRCASSRRSRACIERVSSVKTEQVLNE